MLADFDPTAEEAAVRTVVQNYFDALYDGDVARFREIFHPSCRLWAVTAGEVVSFDYEPYMARVAGRPSSASRGDAREDEILSLTVASPTTAHARVRDCYLPAHFVDELCLLKVAGRWRIVAKTWHAETWQSPLARSTGRPSACRMRTIRRSAAPSASSRCWPPRRRG